MSAAEQNRKMTERIALTGLFTAMTVVLCISIFSIPMPTGSHLYLCDAVICLAALTLGPVEAFIVGGVGSFIGDLMFYPAAMFVSRAAHGLQAVAISLIFRHTLKKRPVLAAIVAVTVGSLIMTAVYTFGRAYVYGTPATALIKIPDALLQSGVGAVIGTVAFFKIVQSSKLKVQR